MSTPVVVELSRLIQAMLIHAASERREDFRPVDGVGRKITGRRSARPGYEGTGLRVTTMESEVTERFLAGKGTMMHDAEEFLEKYGHPAPRS